MRVSADLVGEALRRLEHDADVYLVGRHKSSLDEVEIFTLRSDRFPSTWEGKEVAGELSANRVCIAFTLKHEPIV